MAMAALAQISRKGVTLLEVLVLMGIVALLVTLLLPGIQAAREATRRTTCSHHLHQLTAAMWTYHETHRVFPASTFEFPSWNWGHALLPFVEEQALADGWNERVDLLAPMNLRLAARPIPVFKCPSAIDPPTHRFTYEGQEAEFGTSDYRGCQSVNASDPLLHAWHQSGWLSGVISRARIPARRVKDGLSHTLMLVEEMGGRWHFGPDRQPFLRTPQIWSAVDGSWVGRGMSGMGPAWQGSLIGRDRCTVNCVNMYGAGPYGFHDSGVMVANCDGSIHFVVDTLDPLVISAAYCYFEGQLINEWP